MVRLFEAAHQITPDPLDQRRLLIEKIADRLQQRLKPNALPQQFEIGKAHLPRRWPRHDSTQQTHKGRPKANRSAPNPAGDVGRLLGVAANHLSNERHRASHWQAKLAAENPGNAHSATLFCLWRQKLGSRLN